MKILMIITVVFFGAASLAADTSRPLVVASKNFTESVILGEISQKLLASSGIPTIHKKQLGGTRLLWNALQSGEIDLYPEYTGTLIFEIFYKEKFSDFKDLTAHLQEKGIRIIGPLGFNNSYALGMRKARAKQLNITKVSDLRSHPSLVLAFSNEFMDRKEGWPGLKKSYELPQKKVRGMDHDLAYRGLSSGSIDVTDLFTTDAEIEHYDLVSLIDDRKHFPSYEALFLMREDVLERFSSAEEKLSTLIKKISPARMIEMNSLAKIRKLPEGQIASEFLNESFDLNITFQKDGLWKKLERYTVEHFKLVGISLLAAIIIALPLGVLSAKFSFFGQLILTIVSIIQTIPSLALLVFMIPFVGIGAKPAIVALFLYSLLPIVRNTHQGLMAIPRGLIESAVVLGLSPIARLIKIELPLAVRAILAGIKTSAVINIGTATLGALVGAGGFGQPILTGIRLDNMNLILIGAIPAAMFALIAQFGFDLLEKRLLPRGLRQN
jgi:osmoprotectant transport system permease protein